jgi:hypothetical protein
VFVALVVGFLTVFVQNRQQGGGTSSIAADLAELRGEVTQRNAAVSDRLEALDRGQAEILRRLPPERGVPRRRG